jgi:hypothetical protein
MFHGSNASSISSVFENIEHRQTHGLALLLLLIPIQLCNAVFNRIEFTDLGPFIVSRHLVVRFNKLTPHTIPAADTGDRVFPANPVVATIPIGLEHALKAPKQARGHRFATRRVVFEQHRRLAGRGPPRMTHIHLSEVATLPVSLSTCKRVSSACR